MIKRSQRDPEWSELRLGTSDTKIGTHGCTITDVAMLANLTPKEVNDRLNAVNGYANGNLIIWGKVHEAISWLNFPDMGRGYTYKNDVVKAAIEKNGGCLVAVDINPSDGVDRDDHWVLFTGGGKMIDPYDGKEKPTSTYKPTGYAILDVDTQEKPLPESVWLKNSDKWRGFVWWLLGGDTNPEDTLLDKVKNVINGIKSRLTDLENQVTYERTEKENREDQVSRLKGQLLGEQKLRNDLDTKLSDALKEPAKIMGVYEAQLESQQGVIDSQGKEIGKLKHEAAKLTLQVKGIDAPSRFRVLWEKITNIFNRKES